MESNLEARLQGAVEAYQSLLNTVGECGSQVCPAPGAELQASLLHLSEQLASDSAPRELPKMSKDAERDLRRWGQRSSGYFKEKASEVKELMLLVARTAESMGERDTRHARRFGSLSTHLAEIADLEDITKMRSSLCESIAEMKGCVEQMTKDGQNAVRDLQKEVDVYREKLALAELAVTTDSLTGLANRKGLEAAYQACAQQGRPFSLVVFDLNGFKKINDHLGHLAGDDLLRQFGAALKPAVRSSDVAGRWGGDEFVVLLDCNAREAEDQLNRIRSRVLKEYSLQNGSAIYKLKLSAAIGVAAWKSGDKVEETLKRADEAMYRDKERQKKGAEGRGTAEWGDQQPKK
jgi:diguanylate cyclase